ncbi:MAG: DUF1223 domain-containing protein, partial [Rhodobacterales bacterium]|nr:DUF1223 domain-containing protein [Rhodobacterales bacterium]
LRAHLAAIAPITLSARRDGDTVIIRASADRPLEAPVRLQLVRYIPESTVTIERGENAGKTITYHNIVSAWDSLGDWSGDEPLELSVPFTGDLPGAVILQSPGPAAILAAARVD